MVTPHMPLLDLTAEFGHSERCDAVLIDGKNIVFVPRHDGFLVDMVNDGFEYNM